MSPEVSLSGHDHPRLILTPDQRLRVFVSSTMKELADERTAVRAAITNLSLTPVMFETGARPHPPRALYRSYLEQSHVFVGIYWESYGWVAPEETVSGLEDEYQLSMGLPRLLYVKEPAPNREPRLHALLGRIQGDDAASYRRFETTTELAQLVTNDLMLLLSEEFQAATQRAPEEDRRAIRLSPPAQPLTPIIGRDHEIDSLERLVKDGTRLITVTGAGGVGKTRLVIEVAIRCSGPERKVHFVDLTPVETAASVPAEIARTLRVPLEGNRGAIETLIDYLGDIPLLLVLDNFEHVAAAGVPLLDLPAACAELQLLVTSRQILRLRGETEFPLAPLPVPSEDESGDVLRANATVQLFAERARAAQPDFELTSENLEPVAEICRRLDGLPLAIELAAARVRLLPPDLLLHRLAARLDLLSSGAADLPERQRTLWSAIDWSYNLLALDEQRLFAHLAVFADGWTLDAAEAVCATADGNILDTLVSLLEKSLFVVVGSAQAGEPRMRMLGPIRQFAEERLVDIGEQPEFRERHAQYYGQLVVAHEHDLFDAGQETWSHQLTLEAGNLRAAADWWIGNRDGEALASALWATNQHYWMAGNRQEYYTWVRAAEQLVDSMSRVTRGRFSILQGYMALDFAGPDKAARVLEDALSLLEGVGTDSDIGQAQILLAQIRALEGDPSSIDLLRRVLENPSLQDESFLLAMAHWIAGGIALFAGDLDQAELHLSQGVSLGRQLGNLLVMGAGLERLGFTHLFAGNIEAAANDLRECVAYVRRIHFREGLAYDLQALAGVLTSLGDLPAATQALASAGATHALLGHTGPVGMWSMYRPHFDTLRRQLEDMLGDDFSQTWTRGYGTDVYTAADQALNALGLAEVGHSAPSGS